MTVLCVMGYPAKPNAALKGRHKASRKEFNSSGHRAILLQG